MLPLLDSGATSYAKDREGTADLYTFLLTREGYAMNMMTNYNKANNSRVLYPQHYSPISDSTDNGQDEATTGFNRSHDTPGYNPSDRNEDFWNMVYPEEEFDPDPWLNYLETPGAPEPQIEPEPEYDYKLGSLLIKNNFDPQMTDKIELGGNVMMDELDEVFQSRLPRLPLSEHVEYEHTREWETVQPYVNVESVTGESIVDYCDRTLLLHSCKACPKKKGLCHLCRVSKEAREALKTNMDTGQRFSRHLIRVAKHFNAVAARLQGTDKRTRSKLIGLARNNFYSRALGELDKRRRTRYLQLPHVRIFWNMIRTKKVPVRFRAQNPTEEEEDKENEDIQPPTEEAIGLFQRLKDLATSVVEFTVELLDQIVTGVKQVVRGLFSWLSGITDTILGNIFKRIKDLFVRYFLYEVPQFFKHHWGKLLVIMLVAALVEIKVLGKEMMDTMVRVVLATLAGVVGCKLMADGFWHLLGVDRTELFNQGLDFWNSPVNPNLHKMQVFQDYQISRDIAHAARGKIDDGDLLTKLEVELYHNHYPEGHKDQQEVEMDEFDLPPPEYKACACNGACNCVQFQAENNPDPLHPHWSHGQVQNYTQVICKQVWTERAREIDLQDFIDNIVSRVRPSTGDAWTLVIANTARNYWIQKHPFTAQGGLPQGQVQYETFNDQDTAWMNGFLTQLLAQAGHLVVGFTPEGRQAMMELIALQWMHDNKGEWRIELNENATLLIDTYAPRMKQHLDVMTREQKVTSLAALNNLVGALFQMVRTNGTFQSEAYIGYVHLLDSAQRNYHMIDRMRQRLNQERRIELIRQACRDGHFTGEERQKKLWECCLQEDDDLRIEQEMEEYRAQFQAQNPIEVVATVTSICMGLLGSAAVGQQRCANLLRTITSVNSAGSALSSMASRLLFLLPIGVKESLEYYCTDDAGKAKKEVEDWQILAIALMKVSKIPSVAGSDEFFRQIATCVENGRKFVNDKRLDTDGRALFFPLYLNLLRTHSTLIQMKKNGIDRQKPFSVHIAGRPGIGKTMMARQLAKDACGMIETDFWNRPIGGEFWSGYVNQRAVIYDEFLIGDEEMFLNTIAREYLGLVSTGQFMPEFASTDSPAVGIKGTSVRPELVMTINNRPYDRVEGFDNDALHRRREFVILPQNRADARLLASGQVDLASYSPEEIRKFAWLEFLVLSNMQTRVFQGPPAISYDMLVNFTKWSFDQHKELQLTLALSKEEPDTLDPKLLIEESIRAIQGVPTGEIDLTALLASFSAQGKPGSDTSGNEGDTETSKRRRNGSRKRPDKTGYETAAEFEKQTQPFLEQKIKMDKAHVIKQGIALLPKGCKSFERARDKEATTPDYWKAVGFLEEEADILKMKQQDFDLETLLGQYFCHVFNTIERPKKKSWTVVKCIATAVCILGGIYFAKRALGFVKEPFFFAQSPRPNKNRTGKGKNRKLTRTVGFKAQSGSTQCRLVGSRNTTNVNGLGSGWFMGHYHGLEELLEVDDCLYLEGLGERLELDFTRLQVVSDPDCDFVMFHVPAQKGRPNYKNIVNKFITDEELQKIESASVILKTQEGFKFGSGKFAFNRSYRTDKGKSFTLDTCFMIHAKTQPGDCGALVAINSGPFEGKYIGQHVAGAVGALRTPLALTGLVTKEMILEAMGGTEDLECDDGVEFKAQNFQEMTVPPGEAVFLNRKTQLKKSQIHDRLLEKGFKKTKEPAVLSARDPRGPGCNPEEVHIEILKTKQSAQLDPEEVKEIVEEMYQDYLNVAHMPIGRRELTFEEACGGIPGLLSSVNIKTSPGYPLVFDVRKRKGKKDYIWFDEEGNLQYTEEFREMVEEFIQKMEAGVDPQHVWLGYLKDELVKPSKIQTGRTRIIYASSLIATVAFRMKFGFILVNCNNNFCKIPSCTGMNQYSWDMNALQQYLAEVGPTNRCVAGDYVAFDMRHNDQARDECYRTMFGNEVRRSGEYYTSIKTEEFVAEAERIENLIKFFIKHECDSPCQIGAKRFKINFHCSGCFLTAVMNNWMNEFYLRFCFKRLNPGHVFRECVRFGCLGDDHVGNSKPGVEYSGTQIKQIMESQLAQRYTSDTKEEDPGEYRDFEEVTFLGAHPRRVHGAYSGALKKTTLENTLLWTRNQNLTLQSECRQMVELASQWEESYFTWYQTCIAEALLAEGFEWEWLTYKSTQRVVAERMAVRGFDFVAQNNPEESALEVGKIAQPAEGGGKPATRGLTTLHANRVTLQDHLPGKGMGLSRAIGEQHMDIDYGQNSFIQRTMVNWGTGDGLAKSLWTVKLPFGLLSLGNTTNMQNMPWDRFIYWHGDVELYFQVNGSPFQQGRLIAYFTPLRATACPDIEYMKTYAHVMLVPNRNTTAKLRIPYRFLRTYMNTYARDTESLGSVHLQVYSPLRSKQVGDCTITIYSSFPESKFAIPRPVPNSGLVDRFEQEQEIEFRAQGNTSSSNTYNYENVTGNISTQASRTGAKGHSVKTTAEVKEEVAMDNPMLASGSVPMYQQFSGLSKSVGLEPTLAMQLCPEATYMHGEEYLDQSETSIEFLASRECLIGLQKIDPTTQPDTSLFAVKMSSELDVVGSTASYPPSLAQILLSNFMFWRADLVFTIELARNDYESVRLRAVVAYGAPKFISGAKDVYYNEVLDFVDEKDQHTVVVPYNAATEYLRTDTGDYGGTDVQQNSSLGTFVVMVANRLRSTASVPSEVQIFLRVSLRNVQVAVPRPWSWCPLASLTWDMAEQPSQVNLDMAYRTKPTALEEEFGEDFEDVEFFAQNNPESESPEGTSPIEPGTAAAGDMPVEPKEITQVSTHPGNAFCSHKPQNKFPYLVRSIYDLVRRYHPFEPDFTDTFVGKDSKVRSFHVLPKLPFQDFYAGWSGSIKYRVIIDSLDVDLGGFKIFFEPNPDAKTLSNSTQLIDGVRDGWKENPMDKTKGLYLKYNLTGGMRPIPNGAIELPYQICDKSRMIDFTVPFTTHFNFLETLAKRDRGYRSGVGKIHMYSVNVNWDKIWYEMFISGGDDFRFGLFRMPVRLKPVIFRFGKVADWPQDLRVCVNGQYFVPNPKKGY